MEILQSEKKDVIRAKMKKSKFVNKDGKPLIQEAGTVIEIPVANWVETLEACGGIGNCEWLDIPEEVEGEIQVEDTYHTAMHPDKALPYAAGTIARFTRDQAIRLMLSAGRIRPVDKGVPDLSIFCPQRYRHNPNPGRAKSFTEQMKEKMNFEKFQAFEDHIKSKMKWVSRK